MNTPTSHRKHKKLRRPSLGFFGRNEWAIYGTTCSNVRDWVKGFMTHRPDLNIIFIDGSHDDSKDLHFFTSDGERLISSNTTNYLSDRIIITLLNQADIILVNGNHYQANRQIVVMDQRKEQSVERKLDRLTSVDLIIRYDAEIYAFLNNKINDDTLQLDWNEKINSYNKLLEIYTDHLPEIKALVLAGGNSERMGFDKTSAVYHGKPQLLHLTSECIKIGLDTYLSRRSSGNEDNYDIPVIYDQFNDLGPFGAICSAFMHDPDAAWLVIACDLPFIDDKLIRKLISERDPSKFATAFRAKEKPFPEPLITIYEPRSYSHFLSMLSAGYSCPRKSLLKSEYKEVILENELLVMNANTPEEYQLAKEKLKN